MKYDDVIRGLAAIGAVNPQWSTAIGKGIDAIRELVVDELETAHSQVTSLVVLFGVEPLGDLNSEITQVDNGIVGLRADLERVTKERSAIAEELSAFADKVENLACDGDIDGDRIDADLASARAIATEPFLAYEEARHWEMASKETEATCRALRARIKELEAENEALTKLRHGLIDKNAELAAARERLASLDELSAIGQELDLDDEPEETTRDKLRKEVAYLRALLEAIHNGVHLNITGFEQRAREAVKLETEWVKS